MKFRVVIPMLALLAATLSSGASADCANTNYTLRTQAQVDSFPDDCNDIPGFLRIRDNGSDPITNLDGLDMVTSVGSYLYLDRNSALTDITGLANVASVGTYLRIRSSTLLTSLSGLDGLSTLGGNLYLDRNPALNNISALGSLNAIGGYLRVRDNDALANLAGLEAVASIGSYLRIDGNALLANLDGLSGLGSLGGYLRLENNPALLSTSGLGSVSSYGSYLRIFNNDALPSLDGIAPTGAIGDYLLIRNNDLLADIGSLSGVTSIASYLQIRNNDSLTTLGGLQGLLSVGSYLTIRDNNLLTDTSALSSLNSIATNLSIINNDDLVNLEGFGSLTSVGNNALITGNAQLQNLSGLTAITGTGGDLRVESNGSLTDLTGLAALTSVDGLFRLRNNDALTSLAGLEALISVTGDAVIDRSASLADCSSLIPLVDDFDDGTPGPGPNPGTPGAGQEAAADVGGFVTFDRNVPNCSTRAQVLGSVIAPTFSQAMDPNTISLTGTITETQVQFTIDNSGSNVRATEVAFTNTLPAGLLLADPANGSTDCSGGTVTADANTSVISFSAGLVEGSSSCSITATLVATIAGDFSNTTGDLTFTLGNSGTSNAILKVDDTPPVITVLGNNPLQLLTGDSFSDPGATALDDVDGSVPVSSTDNVDTSTPGVYTVNYEASDAVGNIATDSRSVEVTLRPAPALSLSSDTADFMQVAVGSSGSDVITLTNSGSAQLDISTITAATAPFSQSGGTCAPAPFSLAPSENCTLEYTFAPSLAGAADQDMEIASNAPDSPATLTLMGEGVDLLRSFTSTLPSGLTGTLSFTSSDPLCTFAGDPSFVSGAGMTPAPPENFELHDGLIQFEIENCTPGATVEMQMEYGNTVSPGQGYWKVGSPWREISATISGNIVRFTLVDGGPNDDDGAVNGTIVDPSGAGGVVTTASPPKPVPATPAWVLVVMSLSLLLFGRRRLRQNEASDATG